MKEETMFTPKQVGERIKERRIELKLSMPELGKRIGVNKSTIQRYEADGVDPKRTMIINGLAEALFTTPEWLTGLSDDKEYDSYTLCQKDIEQHIKKYLDTVSSTVKGSRTSKGMNIVNLLQLAEGEKVTNMICQSKDAEQSGGYVTMVTKQGLIKRTPLEQYANIRKSGLIGIALNEGDALAWTRLTSGHDMLIVATRNGQAIRFNEEDARPMGRNGHGVRAIRLAEGDEVVGVCICREGGTVLTVTENGKGRRSDIDTYRITARGGKGIRNYDVSRDKVAAVKIVDDVDDVLLSSQEGIIIRLHANEIPLQSRYGSGVRVMRLGENDKVMVLARTDHDDEAQTEKIDASEAEAEPTAEQLAEMEAADAAAATEAPEADPEEKE